MALVSRHLLIRGRVQGVGYRAAMMDEARAAAVCGWVRNRRDGSVEALVQGEPAAVDALVRWSWRGPASARVTAVLVHEAEHDGTLTAFEARPTA